MTMPPGYASIRGAARALGCAASTLIAAMDDGRIPEKAIVRDPSGRRIGVQVEVVRASMAANTDPLQSARKGVTWSAPPGAPVSDLVLTSTPDSADPVDPTRNELSAEGLRLDNARKALKLAEDLGQVVMADAVEKAATTAARAMRDAMLAIPDRCHVLLAGEPDAGRVHAILSNEIKLALNGLADRLSAGAD